VQLGQELVANVVEWMQFDRLATTLAALARVVAPRRAAGARVRYLVDASPEAALRVGPGRDSRAAALWA